MRQLGNYNRPRQSNSYYRHRTYGRRVNKKRITIFISAVAAGLIVLFICIGNGITEGGNPASNIADTTASGYQSVTEAIQNKDYSAARTQIENMDENSEKEELIGIYEDALFADAAVLLNSKEYVAAYNVAEQSISKKCSDAVEYAVLDAFTMEMFYGADTINQILDTVTGYLAIGNTEEGLEAASNTPQLADERIDPLYQISNQLPKDILPEETNTYYDAYIQALDYGKQLFVTLPDCWDALGEQTEYMTEWGALGDDYSESLATALSFGYYFDDYGDKNYTIPFEYRVLLDANAFFNTDIIATRLKTGVSGGLTAEESDFRNAAWGMSQDEVKQSESIELANVLDKLDSGELSTSEIEKVYVKKIDEIQTALDSGAETCLYGVATDTEGADGINSHIFYVFNNNGQLSSAMIYMGKSINSYSDTEEQDSIVSQINNIFIDKYGEPTASVETIIGIWETDKSVISLNSQTGEEHGEEHEGILFQFVSHEIDLSVATADSSESANLQEDEDVYLPLGIEGIRYDTNSIGAPLIYIRVKNTGDATIDAFDFLVKCFDNYGDSVEGYGSEPYAAFTYQGEEGDIGAGEVFSANDHGIYWTLYGYDTATHYEVALVKVHTTDGTTYERNLTQLEWIPQNE